MEAFREIDIQKEYQNRIGIAYADCSKDQRKQIIDSLGESKFENDFASRMTACFLAHIFMLGLEKVSVHLFLPERINVAIGGACAYTEVSPDEIRSVYDRTELPEEKNISITLKPNAAIWNTYDPMVVAACCCREIYQWIAITEAHTLLTDTGCALTLRPESGTGYYSLSFENDEVMHDVNWEDVEAYIDCADAFVTGFEINPIEPARREHVIIGAGAGASRMLAKALGDLTQSSLEDCWIYLTDPVSEFRDWKRLYDVDMLKNSSCEYPVTSFASLSRQTKGIGCRNPQDAYKLAASCKRYLQEIFAKPTQIKKVTILYSIYEFFGNAFSVQCAKFLQNKGMEIVLLPIQVMPFDLMNKEKRSMAQEVSEEIGKLVSASSHILMEPDDAEARFYSTMNRVVPDAGQIDVEKMKKYTHLLYRDSEIYWISKLGDCLYLSQSQ